MKTVFGSMMGILCLTSCIQAYQLRIANDLPDDVEVSWLSQGQREQEILPTKESLNLGRIDQITDLNLHVLSGRGSDGRQQAEEDITPAQSRSALQNGMFQAVNFRRNVTILLRQTVAGTVGFFIA